MAAQHVGVPGVLRLRLRRWNADYNAAAAKPEKPEKHHHKHHDKHSGKESVELPPIGQASVRSSKRSALTTQSARQATESQKAKPSARGDAIQSGKQNASMVHASAIQSGKQSVTVKPNV